MNRESRYISTQLKYDCVCIEYMTLDEIRYFINTVKVLQCMITVCVQAPSSTRKTFIHLGCYSTGRYPIEMSWFEAAVQNFKN